MPEGKMFGLSSTLRDLSKEQPRIDLKEVRETLKNRTKTIDEDVAAISAIAIEDLWPIIVAERAKALDFSDLNPESDILCQIQKKLIIFMESCVPIAVKKLTGDVKGKQVYYGQQLMMAFQLGLNHYISQNIAAGLHEELSILELAIRVALKQSQEKKALSHEEIAKIITGKNFLRCIIMLALGPKDVSNSFFQVTAAIEPDRNDSTSRCILNPNGFSLSEENEPSLLLDETNKRRIDYLYLIRMSDKYKKQAFTGCPAGFVKGERSTVINEFVEWVAEIVAKHFLPRMNIAQMLQDPEVTHDKLEIHKILDSITPEKADQLEEMRKQNLAKVKIV